MRPPRPRPLAAAAVVLVLLVGLAFGRDRDGGRGSSGTAGMTPHDSYSSSVGVLGCKIDTDRVAYWPGAVSCDNLCVRVSHEGRSLVLLRVDQSQGAHDISYDAWNYLYTGKSATDDPAAGGAVAMRFDEVDAGECADLIRTDGHRLPLSASNSMNFLADCLSRPRSWVARNHVLYNIADAICTMGHDEECHLDWPAANQATCRHQLGDNSELDGEPVYNILYPSGTKVKAGSGDVVDDDDGDDDDDDAAVLVCPSGALLLAAIAFAASW